MSIIGSHCSDIFLAVFIGENEREEEGEEEEREKNRKKMIINTQLLLMNLDKT